MTPGSGWDTSRGQRRLRILAALAREWGCFPGSADPGSEAPGPEAPGPAERVAKRVTRRLDSGLPSGDRARLLRFVDLLGVLAGGIGQDGAAVPRLSASLRGMDRLGKVIPPVGLGVRILREAILLHGEWPTPWGESTDFVEPTGTAGMTQTRREAPLTLSNTAPPTGADVCVVGSGAGGSMVACRLAEAGLDVVVLEAGGGYSEASFPDDEVTALRNLYWRGGYVPTADGNVTLVAGSTVGGGTTINWMNCVPPGEALAEEWARLGVGGSGSDPLNLRVERVMELLGATDACSEPLGANARLEAGARALGWSTFRARLNLDPTRYSPWAAGRAGFGDRSGAKQDARHTLLHRAVAAGARVVPRARVQRIWRVEGKAAGVEGHWTDPQGARHAFRLSTPVVVAACGALETPALLLRSGLGGPAVGHHLRLHPVLALSGIHREAQDPWMGPPQTVVVDEFRDLESGFGFLVETPHFGLGVLAAALPWRGVEEHRRQMALAHRTCTFLGLIRDRGSGRVTLDRQGAARIRYPLRASLDLRHLERARDAMTKLHRAAGAVELWEPGSRGRPVFSAHQMGSARMGPAPRTAAANPLGELHDTPGVWVGDTSAFPSAVGVNPMVTCMALADRTADAILAQTGKAS